MNWLPTSLLLLLLLAYALLILLMRRYDRRARKKQAEWDAQPSIYTLEELHAWYAEHQALEEASLLEPDQPTPWTHALHRAAHYGNHKDKIQLRMTVNDRRISA